MRRGREGAVWLGLIALVPAVWAQEVPLPAELALFTQEELVITPARLEQRLSEVPSATTVITKDQIRRSGLLHLPDILRRIPGVDVVSPTGSQSEVNIRGVNIEQLSPRTLVLVDGRTVFINAHGFTPWEEIPLLLEDIERIEVVRGPVEALYGSPALSGLINIITKHPRSINRTEISQVYGTKHTRDVSLLQGYTINERLAYKLSGGWKEWDNFEGVGSGVGRGTDQDGVDGAVFNGALSCQLDDETEILLSGGASDGDYDALFGPGLGIANVEYRDEFVKLDFSHETLKLQGFWNRIDATGYGPSVQPTLLPANLDVDYLGNVFDVEGQHSVDVGTRNTILWGGGVRYETLDSNLLPASDSFRSETTWTIFLQDELTLLEPLTAFGTIRVDRHPLTDFNLAYRASLLYRFLEDHVLWGTMGRTFRNPTFSESRVDISIPTTSAGISTRLLGAENLSPEVMQSYEVGYRGLIRDRIKVEGTVFYYELHDPMASVRFPRVGTTVTSVVRNLGTVYTTGFELASEVFVAPWLSVFANYTFQELEREDDVFENDVSPRHKGNVGFALTRKRKDHTVSVDLGALFVDTTDAPAGGAKVPPYSLINGRIGYEYQDWVEVSLAAYNLGHDVHKEVIIGQELGTRILAKTTLKF